MEYTIVLYWLNSREIYQTLRRDQERDAFPQARDVRGLGGFEDHEHEDDSVVDCLHELERCAPDVAPERKEVRSQHQRRAGQLKTVYVDGLRCVHSQAIGG